MIFLAPAMLFATALAAAPVIIHLITRRRHKRIAWAAMDFLVDVEARASRRLKLEEILLLAVRTLAILLVTLAAARPLLSARRAPGLPGAVILVDKSASMSYSEGGVTVFDRAREKAREILAALGENTPAIAVTFDSEAYFPSGLAPSADAGEILEALAKEEPGWSGTDYTAALAAAERASKAFASPPGVFLVSDFREGAKGLEAPGGRAPGGRLYFVPVADRPGEDMAVTAIRREGASFTAAAGKLAVTVVNATRGEARVPVTVSVDKAPAGTTAVNVPPGAKVSAVVTADALRSPGAHLVEASLAPDACDRDNRAWAVISVRTLAVSVTAEGDARKFILAALASAPEGTFAVTESPGAFADGHIIAGEPPSGAAAAGVWERVHEGAFVVLFVDPDHLEAAAAFLGASGDRGLSRIMTGRTAAQGQPFRPEANGEHQVTKFIRDAPDASLSSVMLERVAVMRRGEGIADETPLVVDVAGGRTAFLVLARAGRGRVALFNSAADRSTGNFPVTPFFVPLLFETIGWASGDPGRGDGFVCGEPAVLPVAAGKARVEVEGPRGAFPVEVVSTQKGAAAVFAPKEPGFYAAAGVTIAVNVPASECNVALEERGRVERALGGAFIGDADVAMAVARGTTGAELSAWLFAAAMCLFAGEMMLVYHLKRL